jgi:hypothetical protein
MRKLLELDVVQGFGELARRDSGLDDVTVGPALNVGPGVFPLLQVSCNDYLGMEIRS